MKYEKERLVKLNLYVLRQIGRAIGVKCPSSLTKSHLIESILKVQSGELLPTFSNIGRKAIDNESQIKIDKRELENIKKAFLSELDSLTCDYVKKIEKLYEKYASLC